MTLRIQRRRHGFPMTTPVDLHGLQDWIAGADGHPLLQIIAIVAGTFILEDATTLALALLVSNGQVAMPVALTGLYGGIMLGDIWLYGMGRLASSHRRGERMANHKRFAPFRGWLETRMIETVFAVRFVPGLRLPTYTASGFFRLPFPRFVMTVVLATLIWTTALFFATYWLGAATADRLGPWRWVFAALAVGGLMLIGRRNARRIDFNTSSRDSETGNKAADPDDTDD